MEIFKSLNDEGVTIVMITHEPEIAAHAKRTLHIRDGLLVDGSGHKLANGRQGAVKVQQPVQAVPPVQPKIPAPAQPAVQPKPSGGSAGEAIIAGLERQAARQQSEKSKAPAGPAGGEGPKNEE